MEEMQRRGSVPRPSKEEERVGICDAVETRELRKCRPRHLVMSRTVAKQQQFQVGGHTGPPSELPGENVSPQLIGEIAPSWDGSVGRFHLGIVGSREPQ